MLRKNYIDKNIGKNTGPSVQTQTDQFLAFLTFQQKMSDILQQYRKVERELKQALSRIEYLQYKNQMVQSSLLQLTFVFSNKKFDQNIAYLKEIVELQQLINKQTKELELMQNIFVSRIQVEQPLAKQKIEQKRSKVHSSTQKQKYNRQETITPNKVPLSIIDQSCNVKQKNNQTHIEPISLTDRKYFELDSSKNQFLIFDKKDQSKVSQNKFNFRPMKIQEQKQNGISPQKKSTKSNTNRTQLPQTRQSSLNKKKKLMNDKENDYIDKFVKIQAEIKFKKFMDSFETQAKMRNLLNISEEIPQKYTTVPLQSTKESSFIDRSPQRCGTSLTNSMR